MKQILLFSIFLLMPLTGMKAQVSDYDDLFNEGKVWYYDYEGKERKYYFQGDIVINGQTCKKLLGEEDGEVLSCSYLFYKGKDVYYMTTTGEEYPMFFYSEQYHRDYGLLYVDSILVKGHVYKRYNDDYGRPLFIEGIGSSGGIRSPRPVPGNYVAPSFKYCKLNDIVIFTREDCFASSWDPYSSFMAEGKKWNYHYKDLTGMEYDECLMTRGDSILANRNCKKLYSDGNYKGAFYEENDIVYFYYKGKDTPELIYNFNGQKNDVLLKTLDGSIHAGDVDDVTVNGHIFKRIATMIHTGSPNTEPPFFWVKGIGGTKHLLHNHFLPNDYYQFVSCELNGETIFTMEDFNSNGSSAEEIVGIFSVSQNDISKMKDSDIYDLQGRKVNNEQLKMKSGRALPRGLYIMNGKKVIVR